MILYCINMFVDDQCVGLGLGLGLSTCNPLL